MATRNVIAIVGGGPAGALAAERLAHANHQVRLFDEKLAWEKPCGGGVTPKALWRYPFLAEAQVERKFVAACELISPAGRRVCFPLHQKIAIFSRRVLNGLMLDRASQAGAEIVQDRVIAIEGRPGSWRLRSRNGTQFDAAYLIIAAGARNPFRRQFSRPFTSAELMATAGYYIRGSSDRMQIRFIRDLDGYIWTFPRCDHFSAGIAAKMSCKPTAELRRLLEEFLVAEGFHYSEADFFSHVIPSPTEETFKRAPFCGDGWAMAGDAAGFVDPITGEGIYYAFRSAELVADAIIAGRPEAYRTMLSQDLLPELAAAARYAHQFYRGSFLGQPILERMVQFVAESIRFRDMIADLFAGAQAYVSLRGRCYRQLLPLVWDVIVS